MKTRVSSLLLPVGCVCSLLSACNMGGSKEPPPPPPPPNLPPVLVTTAVTATEDTALNSTLVATDPEFTGLFFAISTQPAHGTATLSGTGALSYTPAANYNGADSIGVSVSDGVNTTPGTVAITVSAANDAPVFTSPTISTDEDVALNSNVATYASDFDGNTLTFAVNTAPSHGTLTLTAAGAAIYTPVTNYNGADSFSVHISDGAGGELNGTMSINVVAVNDLPVLVTNQLSVAEDGVLTAQLAATDVENQPIQYQVAVGAGHGQVSITAGGLLTYTPAADYFGADGVLVGVTDGVALTSWPLTLTVNAVNDAPVAFEDLLRLPANASVTLPVLTNDSDVDDNNLTVTILSQPGGGTLSVSPTNVVTFTRDNEFNGPIRFRYRVTDSGGLWAEADVRAVIGEFPGIYYLSDETTVGQPEVHWFDGLRVYRIGIDLDPGVVINSFSMAGDGLTVAYVAESASGARVFFTGPSASDSRVIFTSAPKPGGTASHPYIRLNRNGSYLWVYDPFALNGGAAYMVRTSDGLQTRVGGNTQSIVQIGNYLALSPANDDFYVQAQVGGQPPPMSGSGYLTLFRGNAASAANLTHVGLVYPTPGNGGGSGMEVEVTADGRYAIHEEILFTPNRSSVLAYDGVSGIEAPIYRRPVAGEIGNWNGFALSNDGRRVCFLFREPGGGSFGPSTFVAGDPGVPASAGPVTPVVSGGYKCKFGSDNHTMFYLANTVAEPRQQMFAVDAAAPGTPVLINRPFIAGELLENSWVARDAMRLAFGVRGISSQVDLYSVSLASPGSFIPFATNVFDDGSLPGQLDPSGYVLAYSKRPQPLNGLRRLTLLSTQTPGYNFSLTRGDTSTGLLQFQWAPRP